MHSNQTAGARASLPATFTKQEMIDRRLRLAVAAALEAVGSVEALALIEPLSYQPRSSIDLAAAARLDLGSAEELLRELEKGGVIRRWSKATWQFSVIGAEVWSVVSALLSRPRLRIYFEQEGK